jgi:chromosome transmission fidelity protein 1
LTWLRHHKKKAYEVSIDAAANSFKDEPDWVVEQLLKRKRAEIVDLWDEREAKLRSIRAKELIMEERGKKRKRYGGGNVEDEANDIDEDEEDWLLDEHNDQDMPNFSDRGKESDDIEGDQIKVCQIILYDCIPTFITDETLDILYVQNAFPVDAIHIRAAQAILSSLGAG